MEDIPSSPFSGMPVIPSRDKPSTKTISMLIGLPTVSNPKVIARWAINKGSIKGNFQLPYLGTEAAA